MIHILMSANKNDYTSDSYRSLMKFDEKKFKFGVKLILQDPSIYTINEITE